jgi:hypothetical protein
MVKTGKEHCCHCMQEAVFSRKAKHMSWQNIAEAVLALGGAVGGSAVAASVSPFVGLAVGCGALGAAAMMRLAVAIRICIKE